MKKNEEYVPLDRLLQRTPKPVSVNYKFDWGTFKLRPTTDPALLFKLAGLTVRDLKEGEPTHFSQRGFDSNNAFMVQLTPPITDDSGNIVFNGERAVLYRQAKRQLKFTPMAADPKKYGLSEEDLETGVATKSSDFGDSTTRDYKANFYSPNIREQRRSDKYPLKDFKSGAYPLSHYPYYDISKSDDDEYNESFIRSIDDRTDPYYECLFVVNGGLTKFVDIASLCKAFKRDAITTRIDLTLDITYKDFKQLDRMLELFAVLAGEKETRKIPRHKYMTPGLRNAKSKIKKGTAWKGSDPEDDSFYPGRPDSVLYGSRKAPFYVRVYNKSAERWEQVKEKIKPTLRIEIECKHELARSLYPKIIEGATPEELWETVMSYYLTFDNKPIDEILKIDNKTKHVDLDIQKNESLAVSTQYHLNRQYTKSVASIVERFSPEKQIYYILKCLGGTDFLPDDKKEYDKVMDQLFELIKSGKGEQFIDAINEDEREKKRKQN